MPEKKKSVKAAGKKMFLSERIKQTLSETFGVWERAARKRPISLLG